MKSKIYATAFLLSLTCNLSLAQPVVTYPNGGETLVAGQTVQITWTGTTLGQIVGIDYTTDNWATLTWLNTNYSNPSSNSYTWVVPNTPGTQCAVGVFNTSFAGDVSDNFFTITNATGVQNLAAESFSIYPNPATDVINVSSADKISRIEILNFLGEKITSETINAAKARLSVSQLSGGIYFLNIISSEGNISRHKIQIASR